MHFFFILFQMFAIDICAMISGVILLWIFAHIDLLRECCKFLKRYWFIFAMKITTAAVHWASLIQIARHLKTIFGLLSLHFLRKTYLIMKPLFIRYRYGCQCWKWHETEVSLDYRWRTTWDDLELNRFIIRRKRCSASEYNISPEKLNQFKVKSSHVYNCNKI